MDNVGSLKVETTADAGHAGERNAIRERQTQQDNMPKNFKEKEERKTPYLILNHLIGDQTGKDCPTIEMCQKNGC